MTSSRPKPVHQSSAFSQSGERPKYLPRHHEDNLRAPQNSAIAPVQVRELTHESQREPLRDSSNFRAAQRLMREREESGLTLEEAAALANVSTTTIWRRESGLVDLGALKQLVALEKARGIKGAK